MSHHITRLDNGLRIVTESLPGVRSVSLGFWIESGSRSESPHEEGAAHFLEHMVFKGTARRSALDIALELDRLGGLSNAFTSREATCFHARVVDTGLPLAFDILSDIVLNPLLDPEELALEKGVVLQEIAMSMESPEEYAHEVFWQSIWSDSAFAHSILGTEQTVQSFDADMLATWLRSSYSPDKIIVAAAGAVEHDTLVELCEKAFGDIPAAPQAAPHVPPGYKRFLNTEQRDCEQSHVLLAFPSVGVKDERRFAHSCLSSLMGGQMSSRLFQEIRERRGLAYSVYSAQNCLSDAGVNQIYAGANPQNTQELLDVLHSETTRVTERDVRPEELEHVKEHLTGLLYLSTESTEERMIRLAKNLSLFDDHVPHEKTAARIEAVTLEDIHEAALALYGSSQPSVMVLGPGADGSLLEGWR